MPPYDYLYYAAYGSNLSAARFAVYLAGGAAAGSTWAYVACPHGTAALDVVSDRIPHALYFGDRSVIWGGGKAFVDTSETEGGGAYARLYLLSRAQFEHVVWQENWQSTHAGPLRLRVEEAVLRGHAPSGYSASYDTLLHCGFRSDVPVLTFSRRPGLSGTGLNPPRPAYLRHIIAGLRESHTLADQALITYLSSSPGGPPEDVARAAAGLH